MKDDMHAVSHFVGGQAHGPVRLFVNDAGRVALICEVDGAAWELASAAKVTSPPDVEATASVRQQTLTDGSLETAKARADKPPATSALETVDRLFS